MTSEKVSHSKARFVPTPTEVIQRRELSERERSNPKTLEAKASALARQAIERYPEATTPALLAALIQIMRTIRGVTRRMF